MADEQTLTVELSSAIQTRIEAETGVALTTLTYPDPDGSLGEVWETLSEEDVMCFVRSVALVQRTDARIAELEAWSAEQLAALDRLGSSAGDSD